MLPGFVFFSMAFLRFRASRFQGSVGNLLRFFVVSGFLGLGLLAFASFRFRAQGFKLL